MVWRMRTFVQLLLFFVIQCACAKKQYGLKLNALQSREVTPTSFFWLVIARLVYGIAHLMGVGQNLNKVMGGFLVPPVMRDYDTDDDDDDDGDDYGGDYGGDYDGGGFMDYEY